MSNDFFNFVTALVRKTTARAEPLNTLFTSIQTGFGLLPTKAQLYEGRVNFCGLDTGAANAYVVTAPWTVTLSNGLRLVWVPANTNSGASVLNANALGNVAVTDYGGNALTGGELAAGTAVETIYLAASNQHRILNPLVSIGTVTVNNLLKISGGDTTPGYGENKITASGLLAATKINGGANESLNIASAGYTASGTDTYAITPVPAVTLAAGMAFLVTFTNANTGASTLTLPGNAAKAITKNGATALERNDITAGAQRFLSYDGTQFQISGTAATAVSPAEPLFLQLNFATWGT